MIINPLFFDVRARLAVPAKLFFPVAYTADRTRKSDVPKLPLAPPRDGGISAKNPTLPPPDYSMTPELAFMSLDILFQKVQKLLGATSRADLARIQEAQRELLKKSLESLDKALEKMAREQAARKKAAVFGFLKRLAAVVLIAVAVVAVAATATLTAGTGAFLVIGLLSFAGAFIDMIGSGNAATGGRGFTLATLLKDAGVENGSEALAAALSMDAGDLTSEALKECGASPELVMAFSIVVTIAQALIMNRCSARMLAPDKMSRLMQAATATLKDGAMVSGGFNQSLGAVHTLEATKNQEEGAVARSGMARRDADRTQLDQSIARNIEFMKTLQKASEQSLANLKKIIDEYFSMLEVITGPKGRTAAMA